MTIPTAAFVSASTLILYFLFGYPLLLALLTRRFARPILRAPLRPSISVVIAVHNGERFLADKLRSVFALDYPRGLMEVIVVSDGSTDGSERIASGFEGVKLLRQERGGKPAALNRAFAAATGEILV